MKFQLTSYQTDATADVVNALDEGFGRFKKNQRLTAVSLSAPTGAGKTVIATAVIERLMYGDENTEPNPALTVLWVTDDPSLNQQTRRKMLEGPNGWYILGMTDEGVGISHHGFEMGVEGKIAADTYLLSKGYRLLGGSMAPVEKQ